ncbi:hypothetical protein N7X28_25900 [Bacillus sp. SM-B1]|nr:hypothetical protein [Bacillus sp. SM-B1]
MTGFSIAGNPYNHKVIVAAVLISLSIFLFNFSSRPFHSVFCDLQ